MSAPQVLLSHPTGNANVRQVALALTDAGRLVSFHLGVAACGQNFFGRVSSLPGLSEVKRRRMDDRFADALQLHPWREIGRLMAGRLGWKNLIAHEKGPFCVDRVYQSFDSKVAHWVERFGDQISTVYAYEDGALATFQAAKKRGIRCVYDLPIAYWRTSRALLRQQADRYPTWEPTLIGTRDSAAKCDRKDAELALADVVVCPSSFVSDSLLGADCLNAPVHVIPFGSPEVNQGKPPVSGQPSGTEIRPRNRPLRVFFAGSMTQRKGLADLFAAMKLLDPTQFELHVLGSPIVPLEFYRREYANFTHHASRSHDRVLQLMHSMDVLVLPSIVEGRALVQQEALACGLPIIVTKNAGAEDLAADRSAGCLVPINDPPAIAAELRRLEDDRDLLRQMSDAAIKKATEVTWASYRAGILNAVGASVENPS